MTLAGLPHSEISGSKRACRSPKRIVACHVLHRLLLPRHPPSTLSNLTIKCLDLMRSAVEPICGFLCISSTTHIQLSTNSAVAKTNAERNRMIVPTACLAVLRSSCCCGELSQLPGSRFCSGSTVCTIAQNDRAVGGADRDRTDDPLLAKQVLSQLSYSPIGSASARGLLWRVLKIQ
jgi:hypothetical protein